jgi:hypothetical protein
MAAAPAGAIAGRSPAVQGLVLTATPTAGVAPLVVRFTLTVPAGAPPNLSWDFGDGDYLNGSSTTDATPAHLYEAPGTFRCVVTAEWSTGSVNTSTVIDVGTPVVSVTASAAPANGTAPLTVWLNATAQGGTGTYLGFYWKFGDGNEGSGLSVRYTYTSAGAFQATFTAVDSDGRSGNASVFISVHNATPPGSKDSPPIPPSGNSPYSLTVPVVVAILGVAAALAAGMYLGARRFGTTDDGLERLPGDPRELYAGPSPPPSLPTLAAEPVPIVAAEGGSEPMAMESPALVRPPAPPVLATPSRITDALLRHLVALPQLYPGDLPSKAWTQAGIAEAVGAGQSAVSRVLRRLVAAGIILVETRHVAGSPRRVRIYRLTERGERLGRALREAPPVPRDD